jgi:hypothetical protein
MQVPRQDALSKQYIGHVNGDSLGTLWLTTALTFLISSKMNTATRALRLAARQRLCTRLPQTTTTHSFTRLTATRSIHSSRHDQATAKNPEYSNTAHKPRHNDAIYRKPFADFDVAGKVFVVTGGAQGLGLTMAEALVEAGGKGKTE